MSPPKKKDDAPEQPKKPKRSGVPLHVYIPPDISEAMAACANEFRRKLTQEVIIALENHLKSLGRFPERKQGGE